MLNRIAQSEVVAPGVLETVAQRDQFLPAIDGDTPAVSEIAFELFGVDTKIDDVAVGPDKWMKGLDLGDDRPIFFAAINLYRAGLAQLDRDNPRSWIGAEERRVFLKFHN